MSYDILFTNHNMIERSDKIEIKKQDGMTVEGTLDFLRETQ